jgi:4a-hydroxytetrahydrobiopterin dehydratase
MPPLGPAQVAPLLAQVKNWESVEGRRIRKMFKFADFARALAFVNKIGAIAEDQGHHPDLFLTWGKVGVELWTHKIDGLSESDFIMAAKIDRAFAEGL